jgi:hypothetical protein
VLLYRNVLRSMPERLSSRVLPLCSLLFQSSKITPRLLSGSVPTPEELLNLAKMLDD